MYYPLIILKLQNLSHLNSPKYLILDLCAADVQPATPSTSSSPTKNKNSALEVPRSNTTNMSHSNVGSPTCNLSPSDLEPEEDDAPIASRTRARKIATAQLSWFDGFIRNYAECQKILSEEL